MYNVTFKILVAVLAGILMFIVMDLTLLEALFKSFVTSALAYYMKFDYEDHHIIKTEYKEYDEVKK